MPLYIGESINGIGEAVLKSTAVRVVSSNPIYTALVITLMLMMIVIFIFRDASTDEALSVMAVRTGFWSFLVVLGTVFVHDRILLEDLGTTNREERMAEVFGKGEQYTDADNMIPITRSIPYEDPINIDGLRTTRVESNVPIPAG